MKVLRLVFFPILLLFFLLMAVAYFTEFSLTRITFKPERTITVTGYAKTEQLNQIASFNANVSENGDSKEAVQAVMQTKVDELVKSATEFGVEKEHIKTNYFNIYQEEYTNYDTGTPTVRRGPWRGNTSVGFTKVPIDRADAFAEILVASGATSIDGPNFTLEDPQSLNTQLSIDALKDAQEKAMKIAESQGLGIGELISFSEFGDSAAPFYLRDVAQSAGGGGGFPTGSSEFTKTISATYRLK